MVHQIISALNNFIRILKYLLKTNVGFTMLKPVRRVVCPFGPSKPVKGPCGFIFLYFFFVLTTPAGIIRHVINKIAILTRHADKGCSVDWRTLTLFACVKFSFFLISVDVKVHFCLTSIVSNGKCNVVCCAL